MSEVWLFGLLCLHHSCHVCTALVCVISMRLKGLTAVCCAADLSRVSCDALSANDTHSPHHSRYGRGGHLGLQAGLPSSPT